jgi:hypothetical protein
MRFFPDVPIARLLQPGANRLTPTWQRADPDRIDAALNAALARDPGGWYVAGTSREVRGTTSTTRTIAGRELALWRDGEGELHAGPGACPHLGALLDDCPVVGASLRCRWHGLALPSKAAPGWNPLRAYDDGVLIWVQLPTAGEQRSVAPTITARPPLEGAITAVIAETGHCEPDDIIANRLDPWHGSWLHPYAFSHLTVDEHASDTDRLVVDVAFRLGRTWAVPVRTEFACPDARTIVMTITDGEGTGSVVETHATPIGPDRDGRMRTVMTEATIASSPRLGFRLARPFAPLVRPAMRRTARQLWRDDLAYAERRYELRRRGHQSSTDRAAASE